MLCPSTDLRYGVFTPISSDCSAKQIHSPKDGRGARFNQLVPVKRAAGVLPRAVRCAEGKEMMLAIMLPRLTAQA